MALVQATLALYRDAGRDTLKALPRSGWALVFLVVGGVLEMIVEMALAGSGPGGGLVIGLLDAFLVGTYLALLQVLTAQTRSLRADDLRELLGSYFGDVLTIGFLFGIPRLILALSVPDLVLPYVLAVALLANPIPELIVHDRAEAMAMPGKAFAFMRDNWPEWLFVHGLAFAATAGLLAAVAPFGTALLFFVVEIFSPWMGFMGLGSIGLALAGMGPVGVALAAGLLAGSHAGMLFRSFLYKRLARSSRRSRAWQARVS